VIFGAMKTKNKKTTRRRSIYRSQDSRIGAMFEIAGSPKKVVCFALDYAKTKHVALICDGNGDVLKGAFPVDNSREGVAYLLKELAVTMRRRKVPKSQVFIGGEDMPAYVENFAQVLRDKGFLVVGVNAKEAELNRENLLASTDELDLLGIAKTLVNRRCRVVRDPSSEEPQVYRELRDLMRARRELVKGRTASSNRAHTYVDRLLPGFLDRSKSGITPFGDASLHLMSERFSAAQIARRKPASLAKVLRGQRAQGAEEASAKLISLARGALAPNPAHISSAQRGLAVTVDLISAQDRGATALKLEAAALLAQTPYAFLTSIGGVALVLSAGIAGELGDPERLPPLRSMSGYAGVIPGIGQTGGPDQPGTTRPTPSRCNRRLKDWTIQASGKIAQYGPDEWRARHARREAAGQNALFAGARNFLRVSRCLVVQGIPYISPDARESNATREVLRADAEATFQRLADKWRCVPDWTEVVFAEDRPLGLWRMLMIDIHGADMPLPKKR